jgi:division protein CdvB (Snf7/Vps24/ESCRT-III family)
VIKLFQPPQRIGDVIVYTVGRLKLQRTKLENAMVRLRERDRILFEACIREIKMKRKERAAICANELIEVRKVLNMVTQCQLALERIILRLETIKEISEIMADLKPALKGLHILTKALVNTMPDVAQELQKVNDSISETLAITSVSSSDTITPLMNKTEAGEKILKEVSAVLEQKLAEQLPAPPVPVAPEKVETRENVKKQMISLTATCSEVSQPAQNAEEGKGQSYVTYKDVELHGVSFTIERQPSLEDAILQYAKECRGEIDIDKCALELNVQRDEVEKAIDSLGHKQKIMIER